MKLKSLIVLALALTVIQAQAYGSKSKKKTRADAEKACKAEFGSMTAKNMDKCVKRKMK